MVETGQASAESVLVVQQIATALKVKVRVCKGIATFIEVLGGELSVARLKEELAGRDRAGAQRFQILGEVIYVDLTGKTGEQSPGHKHACVSGTSLVR